MSFITNARRSVADILKRRGRGAQGPAAGTGDARSTGLPDEEPLPKTRGVVHEEKIDRLLQLEDGDSRQSDLDGIDEQARTTNTWGTAEHRRAREQRERAYAAKRGEYRKLSEAELDQAIATLGTNDRSPEPPPPVNRIVERSREAATELASATKRQVRRASMLLELRQLESRLNSAMETLGRDVLPLLEVNPLKDEPVIRERMQAIAALQAEIREKRQALDDAPPPDREQMTSDSVANIDENAKQEASTSQSLKDAAADAAENPPEQGGQG